ncbi:hypothetical protein SAMN05421786_10939 [Chryseobacterium ureilyticum]|uniref:Uncharacterized protein n=1 Tax=Chryseobacterium ureilyticum TaxID=373668 RepID=A0A1N7QDY7_9FLAO|nr:hypothetical protein [Chryseobacterium ureilyticum]SIT21016.1 hypothetical protein SAMN05421786_10939 [Chryseobacterium ureilyticum]
MKTCLFAIILLSFLFSCKTQVNNFTHLKSSNSINLIEKNDSIVVDIPLKFEFKNNTGKVINRLHIVLSDVNRALIDMGDYIIYKKGTLLNFQDEIQPNQAIVFLIRQNHTKISKVASQEAFRNEKINFGDKDSIVLKSKEHYLPLVKTFNQHTDSIKVVGFSNGKKTSYDVLKIDYAK